MQYLGLLFTLRAPGGECVGPDADRGALLAQPLVRPRGRAPSSLSPPSTLSNATTASGRRCPDSGLLSTVLSVALIASSIATGSRPGWASAGRRSCGSGAPSSRPRRLVGLLRRLRRHLPLRDALAVQLPGHRRLVGEDRGLLVHLQLLTGATIPVPDAWFFPYLSTQYYSFQHYGAALMGRVLLLPPGRPTTSRSAC